MKAVGYIRRSSDKQEESLDQQRARLESFAKAQGWTLARVYCDDAISGSDMKRPGLESLLADVERQQDIGVVLTWERNRLARPKDPLDGMILERKLLEHGKRVVYAATGQEAGKSLASGLVSYVENYQNGDYLRKLSRDTMRGLVSRAERGLWSGGPIPFGYDRLILGEDGAARRIVRDMPDGSQDVLDPESGEVLERIAGAHRYQKQDYELCSLVPSEPARVRALRKIFADYAAGRPLRAIREELNRSGLRTNRGRYFAISGLDSILENPAYLGRCVYNRRTQSKWHRHTEGRSVERQDEGFEARPASDWIVKENAWAALVDAKTFACVQVRRKESKEKFAQVKGNAVRSTYLLTGLFTCGVCGGPMFGYTSTNGKGYRTRYYACNTHHRGEHERCPKRYTVPADRLEGHILELIKADLAKLRDDAKLHEYVARELKRVAGDRGDTLGQLHRRVSELDQKLARVREHLKALDPDTAKALGLYEEAQSAQEERKALEEELRGQEAALPRLPSVEEIRKRAAAAFDALDQVLASATIEEKRLVFSKYVRAVEVDPDRKTARISLYTALFNQMVAGAGFEPATFGL